jgi:hypothetical protein
MTAIKNVSSLPWIVPGQPAPVQEALLETVQAIVDAFVLGQAQGGLPIPALQAGPLPAPAPGFDAAGAAQDILRRMIAARQGPGGCWAPGMPAELPRFPDAFAAGPIGGCEAPGGEMSVRDAAGVLAQHWDQVATGKHKTVNKGDLEKVVTSDSASPELKAAANTLLNNPQSISVIAGAHKDMPFPFFPEGDTITKNDINKVVSPGDTTLNGIDPGSGPLPEIDSPADAAAILKKHWDQAGTGKFKTVDKDRLEQLVASNDAPPELKAAANAILRNGWLDQMAHAREEPSPFMPHGAISEADLNTLTSPGFGG